MYERMLNKLIVPSLNDMLKFCGENSELFLFLNEWLTSNFDTNQKIVFPYGNSYGWGIAHRKKNKLICNIFPENGSFTVMIRLSISQFDSVYDKLLDYTKQFVDNKYPCSDGGWIHYRIIKKEHLNDIQKLLSVKLLFI